MLHSWETYGEYNPYWKCDSCGFIFAIPRGVKADKIRDTIEAGTPKGCSMKCSKLLKTKLAHMNVTIYSTPTCHNCVALKKHLKENDVHYTEVDWAKDSSTMEEITEAAGARAVPIMTFEKNGKTEYIVGYDQDTINKALDLT